jgi:sugar transferase (PEP-CTERM/EpsH1 system associated)
MRGQARLPGQGMAMLADLVPGAPKRILVLTPQFPYPPHQGTTIRNYNLIARLAQRHEVHLLSFGDASQSTGAPLTGLCAGVQIVPLPQRSMRQRIMGLFFSGLPDMAQRLPSALFAETLQETMDRVRPDVVEVEGIELAQYLFQAARLRAARKQPRLVFDDHNAEYVLQQRAFETDVQSWSPRRLIGAAYSFVQWRRLRVYERCACLAADRVVAVSDADAQMLKKLLPGLNPAVVPNGVDLEFYAGCFSPLAAGTGPAAGDLVFTGKMDFRPNVDAVLWFCQQVLPLIRQQMPETRFWVVGRDPHPRLAPLAANPAVVVTGRVDDTRPYIATAAVYVIPLRIGGGTRLKVLEAMAMGKAIVSTPLGCEGFGVESNRELVIADAPDEFAAEVLGLLRDVQRREQLGITARQFAASGYDWRIIVPQLEQVFDNPAHPL